MNKNITLPVRKKSYRIALFFLVLPLLILNSFQQSYALEIAIRPKRKIPHFEENIQIFPIKIDGEDSGHFIMMNRKNDRVKAKYFAQGNVYKKFQQWREGKKIILICSGAFTDSNGTPTGISVDNGSIINRVRSTDMDGLVIVYATGGIAVSDIKNEHLTVDSGSSSRKFKLSDDRDLHNMLAWAKANNATIFQTQLLAAKDKLKLDPSRAVKESRERRMLVLVKNTTNNDLEHWIVNVRKNVFLGEISKAVLSFANNEYNRYVYSMLNLDTGNYDILQIFPDEREYSDISGRKEPSDATNLLVYYYE